MPKRYPSEFRRRVLDLLAAGKSVGEVARDLGCQRRSKSHPPSPVENRPPSGPPGRDAPSQSRRGPAAGPKARYRLSLTRGEKSALPANVWRAVDKYPWFVEAHLQT